MCISAISSNSTSTISSTQLFGNSSINSVSHDDSDGKNGSNQASNGLGNLASGISEALFRFGVSTGVQMFTFLKQLKCNLND